MTTTRTTGTSRRPKTPPPDLRFIFKTEDITAAGTTPLITVRADIAQQVAVNHDGTVRTPADERRGTPPGGHDLRNCSWTSRWDGLAGEWDSFALTAQAEPHHDWYGWHAEFREPFAVGLDHAEAMVKVLRKVETRLSRITAQYGQPGGFADWAARILSATGARGTLRPFGRATRPAPDLDGTGYQWMDTDGLRLWLDDQLAAFRKARG